MVELVEVGLTFRLMATLSAISWSQPQKSHDWEGKYSYVHRVHLGGWHETHIGWRLMGKPKVRMTPDGQARAT